MLRVGNVGLVSVTEWGHLSSKPSLLISLQKELLTQSVGPFSVVVPRLPRMGDVRHMHKEIEQFGPIWSK